MAKKKSAKLPKEIAGVKVPKKLRKTANKMIAKAGEPGGREAMIAGAAVLGAAATAFARSGAMDKVIDQATRRAAETIGNIQAQLDREMAKEHTGPWAGMVASAMKAGMEGLRKAREENGLPPVGEAPHTSH